MTNKIMDDHTNTDSDTVQKPLDDCNESNEDILLAAELMRMIAEFDCPANYYDDGLIFTSYTFGFTGSKK